MPSLQEHLARHDLAEVGIAFRRDCPVCRAERALGQLPSTSLVSPRTCAAVTALALATSTAAAPTVLADGQGLAVPAPPSPPPPPANVQAPGGGAAPADTGSAPSGAPAASEHDDDAAARHEGPPYGTTPTPSPTATNEAAGSITSTSPPPAATHPTTGGDGSENDSPAASTDPGTGGAAGEGDSASSAGPGQGGNAIATAAPAAPAPPPTASTPIPTTSQATTGRPPAPTSKLAGHHPARHRDTERPHPWLAPTRSDASMQSRGASRGRTGHGAEPHRGTTSRTGAVRSEATDAEPAPTRAESSRSTRHQRVEVRAPGTYQVQPGDSLWRIAARHLGADATTAQTAREVNRLWELNQQRIGTGNPDLILPGQTLTM